MKLSQTHDLGMLIRVRCNYCRRTRHYQPHDMIMLLGNVEVDSLMGNLRCEECGLRDATEVAGVHVSAGERQSLNVRTLVRINVIRRPVWREN
ncbi:hypothetical protein [Aureimonas sp. AU40]|uniref:hypothetical protein n=1 Tax=Aureimonas sp. AU40 TaxID=1637747 RepID=UPI000AB2037D|nr:hypothetical protein [Aureimonas sp. AU40]